MQLQKREPIAPPRQALLQLKQRGAKSKVLGYKGVQEGYQDVTQRFPRSKK